MNSIPQSSHALNLNDLETRLKFFQSQGFSFFPLIDNSKRPRSSWDVYQERRPWPREIENWLYLKHPNYGIITGTTSGNILGIDLDPKKMDNLPQEYIQRWPTGYQVKTPTDGWHLVYRLPEAVQVKSTADQIARGIDTRGEGGFLVSPGSTIVYRGKDAIRKNVPDGFKGTYTLIGDGQIAPIPEDLLNLLREHNLILGQETPVPASQQVARTYPSATEQHIANALSYVPAWSSYDNWLRIQMAVHSAFPDQRGIDLIEAWSPGYSGEVAAKFKSFEKEYAGTKVGLGTLFYVAQQHGYKPPAPQTPPPVVEADIVINQRYFSPDLLAGDCDLILIGDMGTGKSTSASQLHEQTLIPTHRTRLSKSLAKPFKAVDYRDHDDKIRDSEEINRFWSRGHNITIVINSLHRMIDDGFIPSVPLLFIDEIRQVLAHLNSATFSGADRETAYNVLCAFIKRAKRVIVADAHADQIVIDFLQELRGKDRVKVIRNDFIRERGPLRIYHHKEVLIRTAVDLIEEDTGPVIIPTNSKTQAKDLYEYLTDLYGKDAVMCVHQDTTDAATRYFIEHIADEVHKYRAVIYSPTLGSGIDISSDSKGNPVVVRAICAVLMANPITASDAHQLINRFRHSQEMHIFLQSGHALRETNPETIYQHKLREAVKTGHVAHFDDHGKEVATESQKQLHRLISQIEASDNASLNEFAHDFRRLAKGYSKIEEDTSEDKELRETLYEVHARTLEQEKQAVLQAEPIHPDVYDRLRDTGELRQSHRDGLKRWKIENAAGGQQITPDLYDLLHQPRDRARLFQLVDVLYATDEELQQRDRQDAASAISKRKHYTRKTWLLQRFIRDVFGEAGLHTKPMTKSHLEKMVQQALKPDPKSLFDVFDKRDDESVEPLNVFRWVVRDLLGLEIISEQKMLHGKRFRRYRLDEDTLRRKLKLAARYNEHRQVHPIQLCLSLSSAEESEWQSADYSESGFNIEKNPGFE